MADNPKDISEHYQTGSAVTAAYQTSGLQQADGKLGITTGQADSYTVMTSAQKLDDAGMATLMDKMQARAASVDNGSTGVIASISQNGQGSFEVTAGARGDSQVSVIRIGADNKVSVINLVDDRIPADKMHVMGNDFGNLGDPGANNIHTEKIRLQPGERAIVLTASDGLSDAYIGKGGKAQMQADIEAYVKANPDSPDISRFLTERATAMGAQDNTTIVTTRLDASTDLKGKSVTTAVFDGVGHEDGTLSSQLAKTLEQELPGGQKPAPVAKTELDHVSTRDADITRAKDPGAADPHAAATAKTLQSPAPAGEAPKAETPRKDPPKDNGPKGGGGDDGGSAPVQPKPDKPAGGGDTPATPKANTEAPQTRPKIQIPKVQVPNLPNLPVPKVSKAAQAKLGHGTGAAQVVLDVAKGDYASATITAVQQIATNAKTYEAAADLTRKVAPVAKGLGFVAKKVPVIGAVVTAGFVLHEAGSAALDGHYGKAGAALVAGTAETLGNIVGFGVGDGAREVVRGGIVATAGEKYAPEKSGLRELGEGAWSMGSRFFGGGDDDKKPATTPKPRPKGPGM
jgi:hypothetical protein